MLLMRKLPPRKEELFGCSRKGELLGVSLKDKEEEKVEEISKQHKSIVSLCSVLDLDFLDAHRYVFGQCDTWIVLDVILTS